MLRPSIATLSSRRPSPRWRLPSKRRRAARSESPRRKCTGNTKELSREKFRRACSSRPDAARVIIGHSERRQYFGETDETGFIARRKRRSKRGLRPIVCVGEMLAEREANLTESVLKRQFEGGLAALTDADFSRILIAYEPVWAIGTGRTATPEMAADAHRLHARTGCRLLHGRASVCASDSLRRQRQARKHKGIDGAGGNRWRARWWREPRSEVVRGYRKFLETAGE